VKIVDFGLSNTYKAGETLKTACGSPCYAAPEMVAGKRYIGINVDIWSSGIVLYAMVCGYLPFEDSNTTALYKKIKSADYTIPNDLSSDLRNLITGVLTTDPSKRLNVKEIRTHPWYNIVKPHEKEGIIVGINPILVMK
jgi:5'-AMP-activated protein kinase catalytic alpha subunit